MNAPLKTAANIAGGPERVKYSHDAMIDHLIQNPRVSQNAIAVYFGYSVGWVSRIINSDAFQARLAVRRTELVDPTILSSIDERLNTLANRSLELLHDKLELSSNADFALKVADLSVKALGYGARTANVNVQTNFVVALPQQASSDSDWASKHSERAPLAQRLGADGMQTETVEDAVLKAAPDLANLVAGV
jgi:hypothetical protein